MSKPSWYRQRSYLHFDVPVAVPFAEAITPQKVASHKWSPLIHYTKVEKRYKPSLQKTVPKPRPIMFASHRDACILSKYSADLVGRLDKWYAASGLDDIVVWILGSKELPDDWYAVFRTLTRYRCVDLEELKKHPHLAKRLKDRRPHPLTTIQEVNALGVPIRKNSEKAGIPQGTPISASFSNLYMTGFDLELAAHAATTGALYQRYSDDILVACQPSDADAIEKLVEGKLKEHCLDLQKDKTDRVTLAGLKTLSFQYLGYQLGHGEALLRHKSLSKQWRTARRALKKTERVGTRAIAAGKATQVYTRKLHLRLTGAGPRNFLAYVDRSSETLNSPRLKRQAKKLRRFVQRELARMRGKPPPKP